jgi:hypothetical protein
VEHARLPRRLELPAQVADEDVDHVGVDLEVVAPHARQELVTRQHDARVRGEAQQQLELAAGQVEVAHAPPCATAQRVDVEVADGQRRRRRRVAPQ